MPVPIDSDGDEQHFFELRKEGKIYVSKLFQFSEDGVPIRNVRMVFESADAAEFGELEGALQIRVSPAGKNQVAAIVFQDNQKIRRLSLTAFRQKQGQYHPDRKDSFTFRQGEFERLMQFLKSIEFIDFSNLDTFQIEDQSTQVGRKAIVDRADANLIASIKHLSPADKREFLVSLGNTLSRDDIGLLLGRRTSLREFQAHLAADDWLEREWQDFFEQNFWIFGYGLDYRIMRLFDREMTVGHGGTSNRGKPTVDYLATFRDYTTLVEIKTPGTPIFRKGQSTRAGVAGFSTEFIDAISQALEQKAEWLVSGQATDNFDRAGSRSLLQRTRDPKVVLVIGNKCSFGTDGNLRDKQIRLDTFELFRRDNRNVEIVTFDELHERATYIQKDSDDT